MKFPTRGPQRARWRLRPSCPTVPSKTQLQVELLEDRNLLSADLGLNSDYLLPPEPPAFAPVEPSASIYQHDHAAGLVTDRPPAEILPAEVPVGEPIGATYPLSSIPLLHSKPSADAKLYLDFDGHFEANWGSYSNVYTPVYDYDGDQTTFSTGELAAIQDAWQRVAEDYAPFNIDVTTENPGDFSPNEALRVSIGGNGSWIGPYGGVAYVGSYGSAYIPNTVFAFADGWSSGKWVAEVSSHESGHAFGLQHQSTYDAAGNKVAEYNPGTGDWAPIMGVSYTPRMTTWHNGTSTSSTTYQDDMSILVHEYNDFGYQIDSHGDTLATATTMDVSAGALSAAGVIERNSDLDYLGFRAGAGQVTLTVGVASAGANLDALIELYAADGTLLDSADPAAGYGGSVTATVAGGEYRLLVRPNGPYGYVGQYTVTGSMTEDTGAEIAVTTLAGEIHDDSATSIDFGNTALYLSRTRTFTVRNVGADALTLGETITLPAGFSLASGFGATTLAQGESTTFAVQLDADAVGSYSGEISFTSNDADEGSFNFPVTGTVSTSPGLQIIDDGDEGFGGGLYWYTKNDAGYQGDYKYTAAGDGTWNATWTFGPLTPGSYQVAATWAPHWQLATDSPFTIFDGDTALATIDVNQEIAPDDLTDAGTTWEEMGTFDISSGLLVVKLTNAANEYVAADAIRIERSLLSVLDGTTAVQNGTTDPIDYGAITIGQSEMKTFTVTNTTAGTVTLSPQVSVPAGFRLAAGFGTTTLAAGESTTFTVALDAGGAAGSFQGAVSFDATAGLEQYEFTFAVAGSFVNDLLIDNGDVGYSETGSWKSGSSSIWNYLYDNRFHGSGDGSSRATWNFSGLASGAYEVYVTWSSYSNRASDAPYTVLDGASPVGTIDVDQRANPSGAMLGGRPWQSIGVFNNSSGELTVRLSDDANGVVIADAVRIVRLDTSIVDNGDANYAETGSWGAGSSSLWNYLFDNRYHQAGDGSSTASWSFSGLDSGAYEIYATWSAYSNRASDAPYTVLDGAAPVGTIDVDQRAHPSGEMLGGRPWQSIGVFNNSSGTLTVRLSDDANGVVIADAVRIVKLDTSIVDNGDANYSETGTWKSGSSSLWNYLFDNRFHVAGDGSSTASWSFSGLDSGAYEVYVTWCGYSNRASDAPFTVFDGAAAVGTIDVDQRANPSGEILGGRPWQSIGVFNNSSGTLTVRLSDDANGVVIADAVRIVKLDTSIVDNGDTNYSETGTWKSGSASLWNYLFDNRFHAAGDGSSTASWSFSGLANGAYEVYVTWSGYSNRASDAPYTVLDGGATLGTIDVDQRANPSGETLGGRPWQSIGVFNNSSGTLAVRLSDDANGVVIADAVRIVKLDTSIVDNGDASYSETGDWKSGSASLWNYLFDNRFHAAGDGSSTASWSFSGLDSGAYEVYVTWSGYSNRASDAPYTVLDGASPVGTIDVDQRANPSGELLGGRPWQSIGVFNNSSGTLTVRLSDDANGVVIADAVRIVKLDTSIVDNGDANYAETGSWNSGSASVWNYLFDNCFHQAGDGSATATWSFPGLAQGTYEVFVTWSAYSNRATDAAYTIFDDANPVRTVVVDQQMNPSGDILGSRPWQSIGAFSIDGGTLKVQLSDDANGVVIADAVRIVMIDVPDFQSPQASLAASSSASSLATPTSSAARVAQPNGATAVVIEGGVGSDRTTGHRFDTVDGVWARTPSPPVTGRYEQAILTNRRASRREPSASVSALGSLLDYESDLAWESPLEDTADDATPDLRPFRHRMTAIDLVFEAESEADTADPPPDGPPVPSDEQSAPSEDDAQHGRATTEDV